MRHTVAASPLASAAAITFLTVTHRPAPSERLQTANGEAQIRDEQDHINELRSALQEAVERRNALIVEHYRRISTRRLIKLTGLSRDRLYTIANSPIAGDGA